MARLIADAPKLKAAVDTNDPPTVQDIAGGYQAQLKSNLLLVTNKRGAGAARPSAARRARRAIVANQPAVRDALAGHESLSLLPQPNGILQLVTVPITIGLAQPEILGTLSVGFLLDDALRGAAEADHRQRHRVRHGRPGPRRDAAARALPGAGERAAHDRHLAAAARRRGLRGAAAPAGAPPAIATGRGAGPVALILRSRTEQLRFLRRDPHRPRR